MNYNIIKRLASIEFGNKYSDNDLLVNFEECLEKINKEGVLVLNDFSYFHQFINNGVKSQKIDFRYYYAAIIFQILFILVAIFSGLISGVFNFVTITILIILNSVFIWVYSAFVRQMLFLNKIRKWTIQLSKDLDLINFLSIESLNDFSTIIPFDEKKYAKLWLKEMSTSMNHDWENISLELLPIKNSSIPQIRVTLGGVRKSLQKASEYGFSDKENDAIPNTLMITLLLFSRKKEIRFFGLENEKINIGERVNQLNRHLELLFGKREQSPIYFDKNIETWISKINIIDRSNTDRNNIRQSLDIFNKIINSYVGQNVM
jgi:hypothetical protein